MAGELQHILKPAWRAFNAMRAEIADADMDPWQLDELRRIELMFDEVVSDLTSLEHSFDPSPPPFGRRDRADCRAQCGGTVMSVRKGPTAQGDEIRQACAELRTLSYEWLEPYIRQITRNVLALENGQARPSWGDACEGLEGGASASHCSSVQ